MAYIMSFVGRLLSRFERSMASTVMAQLKHVGQDVIIGRGVKIEHPECVSLGDGVYLSDYCWLSIITLNCELGMPVIKLQPDLTIGDGTYIGRFGTLACINRLTIGRNVMISDRVFIGDAAHGFARTDLPIRDQYMTSKGPVEIGDGTWIGIGVSIMADVKIGRNCVIGAGAVVTRDIPDFSIAAGAPARVMRRIDAP